METTRMDPQMDPALQDDFTALGELSVPDSWEDPEEEERNTFPEPPRPAELDVTLPGGIFLPDDTRLRQVEVRELTGADEERLSRAKDVGTYKRMLLELGVVSIEGRKPNKTLLGDMLIGDRDHLIVAIRRATFGDTMEFPIVCRACEDEQEVIYHFVDDLPVREYEGESDIIPIDLRKGTATVVLPKAADEDVVLKHAEKATIAESNTLMLQQIVQEVNGFPVTTKGDVTNLGMADRRKILDTVHEHRVGPQFDEVTYNCARCGEGGPLVLSVFEMFR